MPTKVSRRIPNKKMMSKFKAGELVGTPALLDHQCSHVLTMVPASGSHVTKQWPIFKTVLKF